EVSLTRYYTTVELSDESVGACMSYYNLHDATLDGAQRRIAEMLRSLGCGACDAAAFDRELADIVTDDRQRFLLVSAVMATVVSACSAAAMRAGGDEVFTVSAQRPSGLTRGVESALIVGLGGYFRTLTTDPSVKHIHVIDLKYQDDGKECDA